MSERPQGHILQIAILVLLAFALLGPVWLNPAETITGAPHTDGLSMFYPLRAFANQELQSGRLPLWNPYVLCGHPFHAEGQGAIFNPINLLLSPLRPALAMNGFALIHLAAAGIFFFFFMRSCGLAISSSLFAATVYLLSSGPISRLYAGHFTIIPFLAWVPALLWAWQTWCRHASRLAVIAGGFAFGCMILAGYPQLVLYGAMYLGFLAMVEFFAGLLRKDGKAAKNVLLFPLLVFAIGAFVGAVQLFPSYQFAGESFREEVSYNFIASFSFTPENLVTLLAPRLFGNLGPEGVGYWGRNYLWEMWIYIGIIPLALAVSAAITQRNRFVTQHAAAAVFFIILALGRFTPLHRLLYEFFPFFNYFRGSSKFSYFALLSLVALAGIGFDALTNRNSQGQNRKTLLVFGGTLLAFLMVGIAMLLLMHPHLPVNAMNRIVAWRVRLAQAEYPMPYGQNTLNVFTLWRHVLPQIVIWLGLSASGLLIALLWKPMKRFGFLVPGLLAALTIADLGWFVSREMPVSPINEVAVDPEFLHVLKNSPSHSRVISTPYSRNALVPYRIESALGYVGNMTSRYNHFLTAVAGLPRELSMATTNYLSSKYFYPAVHYLLLDERQKMPKGESTPIVQKGRRILHRLHRTKPRVYFSASGAFLRSKEKVVAALEANKYDIMRNDIIELKYDTPPKFYAPETGDEVEIMKSAPMEVVIRTKTLGERFLILADSYESNWRCVIDEEQQTYIYPVNLAFRGVKVPEGEHTIAFKYQPRAFYIGAIVTAATLLAMAFSLVGHIIRQKWNRAL